MQIAAVYASCRILSDDMGRLPLRVRDVLAGGGAETNTKHPVARLLRAPNDWQTPIEFLSFLVFSYSLRGNAYAYVQRGKDGTPKALIPLVPDRVNVLINEKSGRIYYQISHPRLGNTVKTTKAEDIIHIRNISLDGGVLGLSPIAAGQVFPPTEKRTNAGG